MPNALRDRAFDLGARPALQPDFTNLNGGLGVGVVGDVGKDRLRVRSEGGLKGIGRVEIEMTHSDICRGRPRRTAGDAFFDRHAFAGGGKLLLNHRHVPGEIIFHVELAARGVGIEYAHLDHVLLLDFDDFERQSGALVLSLFQPNGARDSQSCCEVRRMG